MYQTMPYEEQVKMKEGQIRRIMDPVVKGEYLFEGVKHSPKEFHYRNKMEFSFGDEFKDGPLSLGLHKKGSTYDVLTAGDCQLVHEDMDKILLCVLNYFKERNVSYYKNAACRLSPPSSFKTRRYNRRDSCESCNDNAGRI